MLKTLCHTHLETDRIRKVDLKSRKRGWEPQFRAGWACVLVLAQNLPLPPSEVSSCPSTPPVTQGSGPETAPTAALGRRAPGLCVRDPPCRGCRNALHPSPPGLPGQQFPGAPTKPLERPSGVSALKGISLCPLRTAATTTIPPPLF